MFNLMNGLEDKETYRGVVGLARDGHLVYGPYNRRGERWTCSEHDVCNGAFLEDDSYAYVLKTTFPFVPNCWGPSTNPSSCSDSHCIGPFIESNRLLIEGILIVGGILSLLIFAIIILKHCSIGTVVIATLCQ